MTMKSLIAALAAAAATLAGLGAPDAPPLPEGPSVAAGGGVPSAAAKPKRKISPERLRETIRKVQAKKTGGIIRKAGSAKGTFVILNAQGIVPAEAIAPVADALDKSILVQAKVVPAEAQAVAAGNAKAAITAAGGVLGVALVDGNGPSLLVAPEDGWAVVDVSALAKDRPDAATLAARVRKEALRAFAFVGGGAYVARGEPLMRDVRSASDLDAVDLERFGIEEILHLHESVAHYGLVPWHQATYKKACEEGWAPAPTNEFQKAIFEQVKAEKERGPTNPITIQPPKKK